jgi:hypothetical protein
VGVGEGIGWDGAVGWDAGVAVGAARVGAGVGEGIGSAPVGEGERPPPPYEGYSGWPPCSTPGAGEGVSAGTVARGDGVALAAPERSSPPHAPNASAASASTMTMEGRNLGARDIVTSSPFLRANGPRRSPWRRAAFTSASPGTSQGRA